MKIEIKSEGKFTKLKVDGVDFSEVADRFVLKQNADSPPELIIRIPVTEMDITIPEGCVIVKHENKD